METAGITIQVHPGTLSDHQLDELVDLVDVVSSKSPHFVSLVGVWIEREKARRSNNAEVPLEPAMLQVNAAKWTDDQLADAMIASHVCWQVSGDNSPQVQDLTRQFSFVVTCWAAMRLKNRIED